MQMDPEALYMQLGLLAATMPDLSGDPKPTDIQWLAKLDALLDASGNIANIAELRTMVISLNNSHSFDRFRHAQQIAFILHRALAAAELKAPASLSGSFIPVGNVFEAMAAVGKVLQAAKQDVLIVDPYMDEKALTDFAPLAAEGIAIRLLSDQQTHKSTLGPAQQRWITQYGEKRPLEVRLTAPRVLHDRLIVVDEKDTYVLTQSLNAFATRSPATIVRVDPETSQLKINAYTAIWAAATPL